MDLHPKFWLIDGISEKGIFIPPSSKNLNFKYIFEIGNNKKEIDIKADSDIKAETKLDSSDIPYF